MLIDWSRTRTRLWDPRAACGGAGLRPSGAGDDTLSAAAAVRGIGSAAEQNRQRAVASAHPSPRWRKEPHEGHADESDPRHRAALAVTVFVTGPQHSADGGDRGAPAILVPLPALVAAAVVVAGVAVATRVRRARRRPSRVVRRHLHAVRVRRDAAQRRRARRLLLPRRRAAVPDGAAAVPPRGRCVVPDRQGRGRRLQPRRAGPLFGSPLASAPRRSAC